MDRSLKERVTGASVLVVLAVWLVPWVLDGPVPDAESGSAQAPTAERPAPLRTQTIRLENRQTTSVQGGALDIPGSPTPQDSEEVARVTLEASAGAQPGAPATPVPIRTTAEAQADAPSGSAAVVSAGVSRDVGNAPNPAASGTGSSATPSAEPGSGWFVQVGSFEAEENARRLAGRLADAGYTAGLYPHRSGGRRMYRVRVGPEPSREQADEIASSLLAKEFRAQVVSND